MAHRLRRWPNINTAWDQHIAFCEVFCHFLSKPSIIMFSRDTLDIAQIVTSPDQVVVALKFVN